MSANNRTMFRAWNHIFEHGRSRPRDVASGIRRSRHGTYNALHRLLELGKVVRVGSAPWDIYYEVAPGATPPDCGRGMHPNSRKALADAGKNHGRGVLKDSMFTPCALAEAWSCRPSR